MSDRPIASLSAREAQVLRALWRLREIDTVAQELDLSRNTVRTHLATARSKLGTSSSTTAARWLYEAEARPFETNPDWTMYNAVQGQHEGDATFAGPPVVRDSASPTWSHPAVAVSSEGGRRLSGESLADWLRGTLQIATGMVALVAVAMLAMKLLPKVAAWNTFIFN